MDGPPLPPVYTPAAPARRRAWPWWLVLLALAGWQGWMTCTLFGPDRPWERLTDDEPVVSGAHPLHLYHGYLGARTFCERRTTSCYDPAFQAGYPKTPLFDGGSRPAEMFLALAGGEYRPAAYKIGLAVCCCLVPILLWTAAWGAGLGLEAGCVAVFLGLVVSWATPARSALEAGSLDVLLGGLAGLAFVGLLIRFHRVAGPVSWLGLLLTGWLGWFANPSFFTLLLPLVLVYYLSVGTRHRLAWHVWLLTATAAGLAGNAFWLIDWLTAWCIRRPLQAAFETSPLHDARAVWHAPLWGDAGERVLLAVLLGLAVIGVWLLNQRHERAAARLLGLGAAGFVGLAVLGLTHEPLARLGTAQLVVPGAWFAALPGALGLVGLWLLAVRCAGNAWRAAAVLGVVLAAGAFAGRPFTEPLARHCVRTYPLQIGLSPQQQALVESLRAHTSAEARILWEDHAGEPTESRWAVLLPLLTGRAYLGGLDSHGLIEHAYASLVDGDLAGRPVADWSAAELDEFCRRYNVGWVACRSPATVARFRAWKPAPLTLPGAANGQAFLFNVGAHSFVLKGKARLLCADRLRVGLADVVPEDGRVVVSLHYQPGMQVSPSRVRLEAEPDPYDPIPFIRLRVPGPVAAVTLTWSDR
jgi:hypothetical protein